MIARGSWAGALLVALAGCGVREIDGGLPCQGVEESTSCHDSDAQDAGSDPRCAIGEFVHWSLPWLDPTLLWMGTENDAPECPYKSMTVAYEGHADLVAPTSCEPCTCEPPTGSCALPSKFKTTQLACGAVGPPTSFDATPNWDGHCDKNNPIPQGTADSLTIDPIAMTELGCQSGPALPAKVLSLHWNTFARACDMPWNKGPFVRSLCLPEAPILPGFSLCIFRDGENDCPTDPGNVFTERHVFYNGVQDDRECSSCVCGLPTGSACTATISIYKDDACSVTFAQIPISSVKTTCLDIQIPGQPLGSKSAGPTNYLPGVCPAMGGDASGSAVPTNPGTFCCRP